MVGERCAAFLLQGEGSKGSGQFSQQLERLSLFEGKKISSGGSSHKTRDWDPGGRKVFPRNRVSWELTHNGSY